MEHSPGEPRATQVVHLRKQDYDVYIGRAMPGLSASVWGNPFRIGKDGSREDVIRRYEVWLKEQPELMARLPEIQGRTLGCWCKPSACHGDVLARLADAAVGLARQDARAGPSQASLF